MEVDRRIETLVVGAGPAGTAAAITMAAAGREVVVVDKATFPRDKCCGDGLTTLALRELEALGLQPAAVDGWRNVDQATLRAPGGRTVTVPLPSDAGIYAAIAPRRQFDAALVDLARGRGIELVENRAVADVVESSGGVVVTMTAGDRIERWQVGHVIAADGMWSPVRKALGLDTNGYRGEWHAFRQYVTDVTGPAADELIVWFDEDLLPGYGWSFPLPGGRANVGFGVQRDGAVSGKQLAAIWSSFLDRPHVAAALGPSATPEGRHLAWPIPARVDRATLTSSAGRVLFVGDAAAATDVMTGEGIGQALLTGRLAATAIAAHGAAGGEHYARDVRRELVADHKMSSLLTRVLTHRLGADGVVAILDHAGDWGRRNFARWMFEDEPRAIAVTPRRWHRRFLARPGAYATP